MDASTSRSVLPTPELNSTGGVQAVKVPVSDAVWSTWKRYRDSAGKSTAERRRPCHAQRATVDECRNDAGRYGAQPSSGAPECAVE